MDHYDLVVIGSGPAGEKAAAKAAYFGKRVALVEKEFVYGGAGVHTGTLPSKTLKETALYFSGKYEKGLFGVDKTFNHQASIKDFMFRKNFIVSSENDEVYQNILRHKVDLFNGFAEFRNDHTLLVTASESATEITADFVLIATGSFPFHPDNIPFDRIRVHDSDTILDLDKFPTSLCIVGAGVIGCEYATIFATMGTKVFLVNHSEQILPFLDGEISSALIEQMKKAGIEILFNNSVVQIQKDSDESGPLSVMLANGEFLTCDMFLYAAGRVANTKLLQCQKAGLQPGKRGVIEVDANYRTSVNNIFAAGDVIGFPSLASVSMDQGRVAVSRMFGINDLPQIDRELPFGIYTIPEVSMIGTTEEQAKKGDLNYCTGRSRYRDMPRGKIMGLEDGFLKVVFLRESLQIIGVHIIGQLASELIHYGMMLVHNRLTLTDVIEAVFNYPTLHDLYKYAAYDGLGNLNGHKVKK